MACAPPQLQFLCIAADGRLKALWDNNAVLLLSPGGEAFTHVSPPPGSQPTRQLSEFCLSRFAPLLVQSLRLRNLHVDRPAFCPALARRSAADGDLFSLGYAVQRVYWPETAEEALHDGLAELLDCGRVAVHSRCGAARAVLDAAPRLRFAVCYPLLLPARGGGSAGAGAGGRAHEHVWLTQVFSTRKFPDRWAAALAVASAVADIAEQGFQVPSGGPPPHPPAEGKQPSALTAAGGGQHGWEQTGRGAADSPPPPPVGGPRSAPAWGAPGSDRDRCSAGRDRGGGTVRLKPAEATTELPEVIWPDYGGSGGGCSGGGRSLGAWLQQARPASGGEGGLAGAPLASARGAADRFPVGSWWNEASPLLPHDTQIAVSWTQEASYVFLPECGEVEAWLHEGDSVMTTQGPQFVSHPLPGEADPRIYSAGALPETVVSMATGRRLPVGAVAAHALKLRASMRVAEQHATLQGSKPQRTATPGGAAALRGRLPSRAPAPSSSLMLPPLALPPSEVPLVSNEVVEESDVANLGRFRAYEDGRVRVLFNDRTILELTADHSSCSLVLPDGSKAAVAASNPVGAERHVAVALEFAAWAFRTPAERDALLRAQARVQAELRTTARMAALCEYGSTARLPAAAAWDLRGDGSSPSSAAAAPGAAAAVAPPSRCAVSSGGVTGSGAAWDAEAEEPWAGAGGAWGGCAEASAGYVRADVLPCEGELLAGGSYGAAAGLGSGGGGGGGVGGSNGGGVPWQAAGVQGGGKADEASPAAGGAREPGWSIQAAAADRERAVRDMLLRNSELLRQI